MPERRTIENELNIECVHFVIGLSQTQLLGFHPITPLVGGGSGGCGPPDNFELLELARPVKTRKSRKRRTKQLLLNQNDDVCFHFSIFRLRWFILLLEAKK